MKTKLFAALICVIFVLFSAQYVYAESKEFSIDPGKDYVGVYSDSDKTKIAPLMNMTKTAADDYFKKNNIAYFAVKNDRTVQVSVSVYSNDLSKITGDSSSLDNESLSKLANSLSTDESEQKILLENGIQYIVFTDDVTLSDGKICVSSQYITVADGKIYQLNFFSLGSSESDDVVKTLDTFKINHKASKSPVSVLPMLLIIFGIAVFAAIGIVMLIGIIKRLRLKKEAEAQENYESIDGDG